ncbi:MAG: hypothetical protein SFW67_06410 [Myxococcaceae bacterium]|nr:hypothetical protein [Myxococcaceae bacterium]
MMTLTGLLIAVTLAQPAVRPLDVQGEVTTDAQIVAVNDAFVWFTFGEASTFLFGGSRVFRMSRDGGAVVDAIAGRDWTGTDLFFNEVPGTILRIGGHGRGSALFTFDGEFEAHGRKVLPSEARRGVVVSGSNVLWRSPEGVFLSVAPGLARRLEAAAWVFAPVASTDGRVALTLVGDGGVHVGIVERDGGLNEGPQGRAVASAGATFLWQHEQRLVNEDGEVLGSVAQVRQQANGRVVFVETDGGLRVTDGTPGGTRPLAHHPTRLAGRFAVSSLLDGGLCIESFSTGQVTRVNEWFFGEPLEDRIVDRARELFEDGGIVRRAVHDCDWRRFEPHTRELLCSFDGGLWSRATPDSPEQLLGVLPAMGRATGTRLALDVPRVRGAPLLVFEPVPTWTDGVITRTFEGEGTVAGQSRGRVVLQVDGLTLVDPVSGARTALGLPVQWRAFPSLRELFIQRSEEGTCVLRRRTEGGTFEDLEPMCLRELVDTPGGLLARSVGLRWFRWEADQRRFAELDLSGFFLDADDSWAHFGTTSGSFSSEEGFVDRSENVLLHWKSGRILRAREASQVSLTPQGVFSWSAGEGVLRTRSDEEFSVPSARPPRVSSTRQALWVVTDGEVLVSRGGAFQRVAADASTWANSAAVGEVLFRRTETELVTLSASGETRRFGFVQANPSFATSDLRWFSLDDGVHGFEPWVFDGASLQLAADLNPGKASSHPHFLGLARGRLVVEASRADGTIGWSSLEFEPPPEDPSAPLPERACGCASTSGVGALLALVLAAGRRLRRR